MSGFVLHIRDGARLCRVVEEEDRQRLVALAAWEQDVEEALEIMGLHAGASGWYPVPGELAARLGLEALPDADRELGYSGSPFSDARLSTGHAASSYGQPVLVIDGEAYGPADLLQLPEGTLITAREWVRLAHRHREREYRDEAPLPAPW